MLFQLPLPQRLPHGRPAVHLLAKADGIRLELDLQRGEFLLGHVLGAVRAHRQHQVAHLGGAVPDLHLHVVGQSDAELVEHAARFDDGEPILVPQVGPDLAPHPLQLVQVGQRPPRRVHRDAPLDAKLQTQT